MWRRAIALKMTVGILVGLLGVVAWGQDAGRDSAADEPDRKTTESRDVPTKQQSGAKDGSKTRRPSPEAVMKAFQDQRPTNSPVRSKTMQTSTPRDETGSGAHGLLREGQYINGAAGRLERDGSWWTFVFESDSPETPQPPMRLLPNQKLENMTRAQEASTESIVFEVSGELTLFASQNYLLVRKSLRRRSAENLRK